MKSSPIEYFIIIKYIIKKLGLHSHQLQHIVEPLPTCLFAGQVLF
jgi:hypothetical protein